MWRLRGFASHFCSAVLAGLAQAARRWEPQARLALGEAKDTLCPSLCCSDTHPYALISYLLEVRQLLRCNRSKRA